MQSGRQRIPAGKLLARRRTRLASTTSAKHDSKQNTSAAGPSRGHAPVAPGEWNSAASKGRHTHNPSYRYRGTGYDGYCRGMRTDKMLRSDARPPLLFDKLAILRSFLIAEGPAMFSLRRQVSLRNLPNNLSWLSRAMLAFRPRAMQSHSWA